MVPLEPVALGDMLLAVMAGAFVVLFGALYAAFFAFARLHRLPRLLHLAHLSFALLAACVTLLASALNLDGFWSLLVVLLLAGYFIAPRLIWRLSEATHAGHDAEGSTP